MPSVLSGSITTQGQTKGACAPLPRPSALLVPHPEMNAADGSEKIEEFRKLVSAQNIYIIYIYNIHIYNDIIYIMIIYIYIYLYTGISAGALSEPSKSRSLSASLKRVQFCTPFHSHFRSFHNSDLALVCYDKVFGPHRHCGFLH